MSHVATSLLETYNSLLDPSLFAYMNNDKNRKFLCKQGLLTKQGRVVPEPVYRERLARKSREEHVNEKLALAIVHKALDEERIRQVAIRQKLEEIARLEHVRRVRADRDKNKANRFDQTAIDYGSKPRSSTADVLQRRKQPPNKIRPRSAKVTNRQFRTDAELDRESRDSSVITFTANRTQNHDKDQNSQRSSSKSRTKSAESTPRSRSAGSDSPRSRSRSTQASRHSSLRSTSLDGSIKRTESEHTTQDKSQNDKSRSVSSRSSSSASASSGSSYRNKQKSKPSGSANKPTTSNKKSAAQKKTTKLRFPKSVIDTKHLISLDQAALIEYNRIMQNLMGKRAYKPMAFVPKPPEQRRTGRTRTAVASRRGLHQATKKKSPQSKGSSPRSHSHSRSRSQSARLPKSTEGVKSLCELTFRFNGPSKSDKKSKKNEEHSIVLEQQHCGGNTIEIYSGLLVPGSEFTVVSQRHRNFPFGISVYVDGQQVCRLSRCCEAKYKAGAEFAKGIFTLTRVDNARPCAECRVNATHPYKRPVRQLRNDRHSPPPSTASEDTTKSSSFKPKDDDYAENDFESPEDSPAPSRQESDSYKNENQPRAAALQSRSPSPASNSWSHAAEESAARDGDKSLSESVTVDVEGGSVMMTLRNSDVNAIRELILKRGARSKLGAASDADTNVTVIISGNVQLHQSPPDPRPPSVETATGKKPRPKRKTSSSSSNASSTVAPESPSSRTADQVPSNEQLPAPSPPSDTGSVGDNNENRKRSDSVADLDSEDVIEITIVSVVLFENAPIRANKLTVEYCFLDVPNHQLKTSTAVQQVAAGEHLRIGFSKQFAIDRQNNPHRRQLLAGTLEPGDREFVRFYVGFESDEESSYAGAGGVSLLQLLRDGADYYDKPVALHDLQNEAKQIGQLFVTVRAIAALRKVDAESESEGQEQPAMTPAASSDIKKESSGGNVPADRASADEYLNAEPANANDEEPEESPIVTSEDSPPVEPIPLPSPSTDEEFEDTPSTMTPASTERDKAVNEIVAARTVLLDSESYSVAKSDGVIDAIRQNQGFESLIAMSVPELNDGQLDEILTAVADSPSVVTLKNLTLSGCDGLTEKSGSIVGRFLPIFRQLESLTITEVLLGNSGVKDLVDAILKYFSDCRDADSSSIYNVFKLRCLHLTGCNISGDGVQAITKLVRESTPIDSLNLVRCDPGVPKDTWVNFCDAVSSNTELTSLDLSECVLGDEGVQTICEIIKTNKTLKLFSIRANLCKGECTSSLLELVKSHPTLERIEFAVGNDFSNEQTSQIERIVAQKAAGHLDNEDDDV